MATLPNAYFDRTDASKEYEEHLFIAGRGLQSAELNEIQKTSTNRLRGIADALFKDGDIIRDAAVVVDESTGVVQCGSGAIYLRGSVRGVGPATFTLPVVGVFAVGIRLVETVITALEDPELRDPATGTRNYNEPGAERLRTHAQWGWSDDDGPGEFFPVYTVTNAVLGAKEAPPNLDSVTQALARYDRDSAGGTYVVSGLKVTQMPDVGGQQVYSIAEGRARVYGQAIELRTSRRANLTATPDLKLIENEPQLSSTVGAQRFDFDRKPGTNITSVSITSEKTVTLTHGVVTGAQDPLPDTSVLAILSVTQGGTTYVTTTDYLLTDSKVDWSPAGAEPAPGSTYSVTYQYITQATPTAIDDGGFTVTGAVVGTLILATYSQKLPRIDRLCLDSNGDTVWLVGVASAFNPQMPTVPGDMLALARIYQSWTPTGRVVANDSVRVVPMPVLASIDSRFDLVMQLIAQQRLESNIHTREGGTKKGLFTDPFLDDTQRDQGTPQTAAIVRGILMLPIDATIHQMGNDVSLPTTCTYSSIVVLEQSLRTGVMKINPYMAFAPVPPRMVLTPAIDRWTETVTEWASNAPGRIVFEGEGDSVWYLSPSTARSSLIASSSSALENLRSISVNIELSGFGAGEALAGLTFDGVAVATVPPSPVANGAGVLTASFTIPPGIPSGSKAVVATSGSGSVCRATFTGQGSLERQTWQNQFTLVGTRFWSWNSPPVPPVTEGRGEGARDPLAQTFSLPETTQVSGIDIWFSTASTTRTSVQIRETTTGFPNQVVLAESSFEPGFIVGGGAHTRVLFDSPALLRGDTEYAIVVLCDDANGALSVAELGNFDPVSQRWITSQPYTVGVLLSSSNAITWTAHQDRDMAFRVLGTNYTSTTRTVDLGDVTVTGATDLMLMAFADRPSSVTSVDYTLTLPDLSVVTVSDGQPLQLTSAITGTVSVAANLVGSTELSPVLFPGSQLVAGAVGLTGDYVTRAIPAGLSAVAKIIYEAVVPSGATVQAFVKGPDGGDTWLEVTSPTMVPGDSGFTEFTHTSAALGELTVQVKLVLNGTPAARPRVRDLRVIVL